MRLWWSLVILIKYRMLGSVRCMSPYTQVAYICVLCAYIVIFAIVMLIVTHAHIQISLDSGDGVGVVSAYYI